MSSLLKLSLQLEENQEILKAYRFHRFDHKIDVQYVDCFLVQAVGLKALLL